MVTVAPKVLQQLADILADIRAVIPVLAVANGRLAWVPKFGPTNPSSPSIRQSNARIS
jgi:hypothetical protein